MNLSGAKSAERVFKAAVLSISGLLGSAVVIGFFPSQAHLLLIGTAFVFIYLGLESIAYYSRARKWIYSEARIRNIKEDWIDVALFFSKLRYFYPLIEYEYKFNSRDYSSNQVSFEMENIWVPEFDQWGMKTNNEAKFWEDWQNGKSIAVWVNPEMPSESVIVKEISKKHRSQGMALIVGGALIGLFWIFLLFSGVIPHF